MNIFLSVEAEAPATSYWFTLQKEINSNLVAIKDKDYGDEFTNIAIITIIMSEKFLDGYPERSLIKRKSKEADIRLQIDYKSFVRASAQKRKLIYIKHIVQCINLIKSKSKGNFNADRLITDILQYNNVSCEEIENV